MSDGNYGREESGLIEIQQRAANLRINKIKAEKEFLDLMGKDVTPEEAAEIHKKRAAILYQLELEGAEIEKEFVEKYRSKFASFHIRFPGLGGLGGLGGIEGSFGCPFCTQCVTSCTECVTSCTGCVACSNNVF